jgi:hypothetical protein
LSWGIKWFEVEAVSVLFEFCFRGKREVQEASADLTRYSGRWGLKGNATCFDASWALLRFMIDEGRLAEYI